MFLKSSEVIFLIELLKYKMVQSLKPGLPNFYPADPLYGTGIETPIFLSASGNNFKSFLTLLPSAGKHGTAKLYVRLRTLSDRKACGRE